MNKHKDYFEKYDSNDLKHSLIIVVNSNCAGSGIYNYYKYVKFETQATQEIKAYSLLLPTLMIKQIFIYDAKTDNFFTYDYYNLRLPTIENYLKKYPKSFLNDIERKGDKK